MNVRRAVQIFSPPVTAALKYLKNLKFHRSDFANSGATIEFLSAMFKWFSADDTAHDNLSRCEDIVCFFSSDDERLNWLEYEFLLYLESIKQACANSNTPPIEISK